VRCRWHFQQITPSRVVQVVQVVAIQQAQMDLTQYFLLLHQQAVAVVVVMTLQARQVVAVAVVVA
jgi:hypothetical protein